MKNKRFFIRLIALPVILFLGEFSLLSQNFDQVLRGKVVDEDNAPVPGAAVFLSGSKGGEVTDLNGEFTLRLPTKHDGFIVVQFIGYADAKVPITGKNNVLVQLIPDALNIEESIVYAAYGAMKKSDITGSVSSVHVDPLQASRAASFDQLLSGRASGVQVVSGNGAPGSAVKIRVRGTGSLRGENEPLYVVDGSIIQTDGVSDPLTSFGSNKGNATQQAQNPLSLISPQDIESIEILKDASATAIYGSQGANGVILITTKKASKGEAQINYTNTFTLSTLSKKLDLLTLEEYASLRNKLYAINGNTTNHFDPENVSETDWQNEMFKTALSNNHRISITGRNKTTSYYVAAGITDQNGIIEKTGFDQQDFRINLSTDVNNWLKVSSATLFAHQENNMTSGVEYLGNRNIIYQILCHGPFDGNHDENGNLDENSILESPRTWMEDYDDNTIEYRLNSAFTADAKLLDWLTWSNKVTIDYRNSSRSKWYGLHTSTGRESNGQASIAYMRTMLFNVESLFMFKHKFGDRHSVSGTFGVVYNDCQNNSDGAVGEDFPNYQLRANGITSAQQYYPFTHSITSQQLFSALARVIWNYKDKYVLTTTFRADASSKFNDENKFGYFPSFSGAWRVSEEPFLKGNGVLSNLKIRAGWGQVGNQAVAAYQTLPLYNRNSYANSGNSGILTGYIPGNLTNPLLKWETSEQTNVGVDVGLFAGRVSFTIDGYIRDSNNLLQQFSVPACTGFKTMWLNRGVIRNKGLELSFDTTPVHKGDFMWTVSGNISFNRNRILSLGMQPTQLGAMKNVVGYLGNNIAYGSYLNCPGNAFIEGMPIGVFFGYETDGIMTQDGYDSQDPSCRLMLNGKEIIPGSIKYVDQNGDNNVNENDRVLLGEPNPDFTGGLQTSVSYKGLSLSISATGSFGNQIINGTKVRLTDVSVASNHLRESVVNAWTSNNENTYWPRIGYYDFNQVTDRIVEDASYIRLDSVILSYLLDLKKYGIFFNTLSLNASVGNAFVLTKYTGFDPEVDSFPYDPNRVGIDFNSYPRARSFTCGISLTF